MLWFGLVVACQGTPPKPASSGGEEPRTPAPGVEDAGVTEGPLDRPSIDAVTYAVAPFHEKVKDCYDKGLEKNPKLAGSLKYRILIKKDGAAMAVEDFGSDLPDEDVKACVVAVLRGIKYPPFRADYEIGVPFRLVPAHALRGPQDVGLDAAR